jgi:hypothetical protein
MIDHAQVSRPPRQLTVGQKQAQEVALEGRRR